MESNRRLEDRDVLPQAIQGLTKSFNHKVTKTKTQEKKRREMRCLPALSLFFVFVPSCLGVFVVKALTLWLRSSYFASGNTGSISTGTFFNLSNACCIGGRITAYLSNIAFALSYEPSASTVSNSRVNFVTDCLIFE